MRSDHHTTQFDELGSRYEDVYGQNEGQIEFVTKALQLLRDGRPGSSTPKVLDMGVGTGRPTAALAAAAGMEVYGYDYSSKMLELARKNVPDGHFEQAHHMEFSPPSPASSSAAADGERTGDGIYDGVFAIFTTAALTKEEMKTLFAEKLARWVKKGGYLFFANFSLDSYPADTEITEADGESAQVASRFFGEKAHFLVWTGEGWSNLLRSGGFEIVEKYVKPFKPDADCDWEPHEYTIARRI